jgi:hypothetical protein
MKHESPRLLDIEERIEGFDRLADPLALVRRDALPHHAHVHAQVVDSACNVVVYGVDLSLWVCPNLELDVGDLDHGTRRLVTDAPEVLALGEFKCFDEHLALRHRRIWLQAEDKFALSKWPVILELGFDVGQSLQEISKRPFQSILR